MIKHSSQSGFALLLSVIVSSIVLAIGLTMLSITIKQLSLSSVVRESEISFQSATSGLECLRYHRTTDFDSYKQPLPPGNSSAPNISCFSASPNIADAYALDGSATTHTNEFNYQFDWIGAGSNKCTEVDMYVMSAENSSVPYVMDFSSFGHNISNEVGVNGVKSCPSYSVCTIVISRGYNRACSDLSGTSLLTVQREITSEF